MFKNKNKLTHTKNTAIDPVTCCKYTCKTRREWKGKRIAARGIRNCFPSNPPRVLRTCVQLQVLGDGYESSFWIEDSCLELRRFGIVFPSGQISLRLCLSCLILLVFRFPVWKTGAVILIFFALPFLILNLLEEGIDGWVWGFFNYYVFLWQVPLNGSNWKEP